MNKYTPDERLKDFSDIIVQEIKEISPTTKIAFLVSPEDILIELLEVSG